MIATWSKGDVEAGMPEDLLLDVARLVERHPWWYARARLTVALLRRAQVHPPARVLDAGCGWGLTLDHLEKHNYPTVGLDISRQTLDRIDREDRTLIEADLTQALPAAVEPFDAVLALDVIEHIDDDRAVVARLGQVVRPGGVVIVSVPALPALFSEFDEVQGHRRRYLPETLAQAFEDTALVLDAIHWWGGWMVPLLRRRRKQPRGGSGQSPAAIYRRYLTLPFWPARPVLRLFFYVDHFRTLFGNPHTGTSLFAVAHRPADSSL